MYIAIDIGGTTIRIASARDTSIPHFDEIQKFEIENNYENDLSHIVTAIHELSHAEMLTAIGCGFPGTLSDDKLTIHLAPNLPDWNGKSFGKDLENEFHTTVKIENDDMVASLGEAAFGNGIGLNFTYITWGTGIGAAFVSRDNGHIYIKQVEAGHHIIVWQDGRPCGCGQYGCAEAYIGGGNIEKHYGKSAGELNNEEWHEICEYASQAILNIIVFNPVSRVIIGGGVGIHQKENIQYISEVVHSRLQIQPMPEIVEAKLGDDAGLFGSLAIHTLH